MYRGIGIWPGLAVAGLLLVASPRPAPAAGVRCADLPAPIYVAGSSAAGPFLQSLSAPLLADADSAVLVYQHKGSCAAVEAVGRDVDPKRCAQGGCVFGSASFYAEDGSLKTCDLGPDGTHLDLALSDVFAGSCPAFGGGVPKGLLDVLGPVSPLAAVAPRELPEPALLAEEGHFVFGFGESAGVPPWTQNDSIFIRDERSAGQVLLGLHIQVPPGRFKGTATASAEEMTRKLLSGDPAHSIGFLPTSLYDPRRRDLKALAFRAFGQRYAFYPDKKTTSYEKQNVRDGHYPLWGYLHGLARADAMNPDQAATRGARRILDLLTGKTHLGALDPVLLQVQAGLLPQCAMKVRRGSDPEPLSPYEPAEPCGCWFDKMVKMGTTSCSACTNDKPCGGGHCRRGFCEAH